MPSSFYILISFDPVFPFILPKTLFRRWESTLEITGVMFPDVPFREARLNPHVGGEDPALPTNSYLLSPASLNLPLAHGPADKPAELAHAEFPGRAGLSHFERTSAHFPAGAHILQPLFQGREKQHLTFHVGRNSSPPLFHALHRPDRNSQKLGNFSLGFLQPLTKGHEFFGVHQEPLLLENMLRAEFFS